MSAIPSKIQSFFDKGFLPGGGDLDVVRSYDSERRGEVSLNCISKVEGIATSLLHSAKGGLVVMLEERVGEGGILDEALARNEDLIKAKEIEFAKILPGFATSAARNFVLKQDHTFIEAITAKAHQTALFILNLEVRPGENESEDGCKEIGRPPISSDKIDAVLISERVIGKDVDGKVISVPSMSMKMNFCYKDETDNPQTIKELGPIDVPNYQQALLELVTQKKPSLSANPIYTHMTRL